MRSTAVGGIVLLAVVLAGAGCSQSAVSPAAASSTPEPATSEAASPDSSASPSVGPSEGPASGVKITFEKVKSKRWGAKPFKVEAEAASGAKLKYSAKGSCTVRSVSGLVEIEEAGDCVITARTADGEPGMASTTIRVRPAKPKIQFAGDSVRFQRPFSYSLNAKVSPKIPLTFTLNAGSRPGMQSRQGKTDPHAAQAIPRARLRGPGIGYEDVAELRDAEACGREGPRQVSLVECGREKPQGDPLRGRWRHGSSHRSRGLRRRARYCR